MLRLLQPVDSSQSIEIMQTPVYFENRTWRIVASLIWDGILLLACIGVFILLMLQSPLLFSRGTVFRQWLPMGLLTMAMVFVFRKGGIDLSLGSIAGLVGMVTAVLVGRAAVPLPLAIVTGMLVALVIGLFNGLIVGFTRLPGFLITLLVGFLARNFCLALSQGLPVPFPFGSGEIIYAVGWLIFILMSVFAVVWTQLPAAGVKNDRVREESWLMRSASLGLPYLVTGVVAGFVGLMLIYRLNTAIVTLGMNYEMNAALAIILGGAWFGGRYGNPIGAILATLFLSSLESLFAMYGLEWALSAISIGFIFIVGFIANYAYHLIVGAIYRRRQEGKTVNADLTADR